jgi:DNA recombination-dependent growth factor C
LLSETGRDRIAARFVFGTTEFHTGIQQMALRPSGSFRRYFTPGVRPKIDDDAFYEKLRAQRFRSIDEQPIATPSIGWVAAMSFASSDFRPETVFFGPVIRVHIRIDVKKLPANAVKLRVHEAVREVGGKVAQSAKAKLREEIEKELLGRTVPGTKILDVFWRPLEQTVLLAATSNAAHDAFSELFRKSFGHSPVPATPITLAERLVGKDIGLDRLKRLEPFALAEGAA